MIMFFCIVFYFFYQYNNDNENVYFMMASCTLNKAVVELITTKSINYNATKIKIDIQYFYYKRYKKNCLKSTYKLQLCLPIVTVHRSV